jgi:hypothetical protein
MRIIFPRPEPEWARIWNNYYGSSFQAMFEYIMLTDHIGTDVYR